MFAQHSGQMKQMFPTPEVRNRVICVPGVGSTNPFSTLIADMMPDLAFVSACQCFPRYRYESHNKKHGELLEEQPDLICIDNIPDTALRVFRVHYDDNRITKDVIFDYVYGVLHAPAWRERFANDLTKDLPRVPLAPDFCAFAEAGRALAEVHLGYETCQEYPLRAVIKREGEVRPEHCRMEKRAMRFAGDRTELIVNEHLRLVGIPPKAHEYQVNGRTPLEWLIDRYRVTQDKESGIINDPNKWFDDPRDLIATIRRIVYVSVETVDIVSGLPDPFPEEMDDGEGSG